MKYFMFILLFVFAASMQFCQADFVFSDEVLLFPQPQEVTYQKDDFTIDEKTLVVLKDGYSDKDLTGIQMLEGDLGIYPDFVEISKTDVKKNVIILAEENMIAQIEKKFFSAGYIEKNIFPGMKPCPPEGYRLAVKEDFILVLGADQAGTFYGVQTLRQLFRKTRKSPQVTIRDYPDMKIRGVYGFKGGMEEHIKNIAAMKMNFLMWEADWFHLSDPGNFANMSEFFKLCRKYFIEPVPELQSFGWAYSILQIDPTCVEGVYLKDKLLTARDSLLVEKSRQSKTPVVRDNNFRKARKNRFKYWDQDDFGKTIFADKKEKCVMISRQPGQELEAHSRLWQKIVCAPNTYYSLEVNMKTENIESGTAYIEVYGINVNPEKLLAATPGIEQTTDWTKHKAIFSCESYSSLMIYVRMQGGTGKAWFKEVNCTPVGKWISPLVNIIYNENSPIIITNKAKTVTYEEGKDYNVIAGVTAYPYNTNNKPWNIKVTESSRIKEGDRVLASYNYAPQGSMSYCPSEPRVYEIMKNAIQSTIDLFHPAYIHLGHDEIRCIGRDSRCKNRGMTNAELLLEDLSRLNDYAKESDPNIRVMIWSDCLDPEFNAPALKLKSTADSAPKDIIMCNWWYDAGPKHSKKERKMLKYFGSKGFMSTGASCGYNLRNSYDWAQACVDENKNGADKCLGTIYTSWNNTWAGLAITAEFSWSAGKPDLSSSGDREKELSILKEKIEKEY